MTCFAYVFPCAWEDHCKIGFSRDPLARIRQLHPRWFECFDLQAGFLVEAETERDARDLELELRRPLHEHKAPQPTTIREAAGGYTEWVRGASAAISGAAEGLARRGFTVHAPLHDWLREALQGRSPLLYEWTLAQLGAYPDHEPTTRGARRAVLDMLDACRALGLPLSGLLAPEIARWYERHRVT